jgi:integrase
MKNLYRRSGIWQYCFTHGAKRYRGSCGKGADYKAAKRLLEKRQREVANAAIDGPQPDRVSFAAFAEDFLATDSPQKKSKDRDRIALDVFRSHWPGIRLDAITAKMVADFTAKRLKYRAAATVHRELRTLKRALKMAVEWGKLRAAPAIALPTVRNNRVSYLEPDKMQQLAEAWPDWFRPYCIMGWKAGARRGEILGLPWSGCDLKSGLITFMDTKNGETGTVAMNATVRRMLQSLPQPVNRSQLVFPAYQQAKNAGSWLTVFDRTWRRACKAAGVSGFTFHDLRHQAATELLARGADLNDVRDFLRHKNMNMTLRYAHLVKGRRTQTAHLLDDTLPQKWPQSAT